MKNTSKINLTPSLTSTHKTHGKTQENKYSKKPLTNIKPSQTQPKTTTETKTKSKTQTTPKLTSTKNFSAMLVMLNGLDCFEGYAFED